ncbi:uncharacterized protein METZ01_LOCUS334219, partial [marine metagenome]
MKHLLLTTIAAVLVVGCGESPNELLHKAAILGNIETVKQHLADGADVNAMDKGDQTPLHRAAIYGHKEIAELLIANGADVNAKNEDGYTPLLSAVGLLANHARSLGIVELLIAKGADLSVKTKHGETALVLATFTGQREVVELLIEKGAAINANGNFDGATALHVACMMGKMKIVELLINRGADINVRDFGGTTPLDRATFYDNHGYITDGVERTNLSGFLRKHGGKTSAELRKAAGNSKPLSEADQLLEAAASGNVETVKTLLAAGVDVNGEEGSTPFGATPLHYAALDGRKEVVELLLEKGADVNLKNDDDRTPLDWA